MSKPRKETMTVMSVDEEGAAEEIVCLPKRNGAMTSDLLRLLLENEAFSAAIDAAGAAYFCLHLDRGEMAVNRRWSGMFGYQPEELPSGASFEAWWLAQIHPEDVDRVVSAYRDFVHADAEAFNVVFRQRHKCGSWVWVRTAAEAVHRAPDGTVRILSGLAVDVTEQKLTEGQQSESEATFRSYMAVAPDGIFVTDEKGMFVDVNRAACRMTGYDSEALVTLSLRGLCHPRDMESERRLFESLVREGSAAGELRFVKRDGALGFWLVEGRRVSRNRFLVVARENTENTQMAEQLRQAEKMQVVGQLAGGIAHDFNNQLSGMLGYAELLREDAADNPILTQYAEHIITGVKRASDLTAKLLAFSRKGKYFNTLVDVHRIIQEVVNLLTHTIDKRITIEQTLSASPSSTMGDPTQLQNAILNLALNARDAMPDGGVLRFSTDVVQVDQVYCDAQPYHMSPGDYLTISVTDTGVGMDKATMDRIFEPFFTTKSQGKGTGMGLSAAYGTVKSHRGVITVESTPGRGTEFVLYFPLARSVVEPVEAEPAASTTPRADAHILLVEDERMIRTVAKAMLEKMGYRVSVCMNGDEAVAKYREDGDNIDLIILDVIMPALDGEETLDRLLAIDPSVSVLVTSGYSIEGKAERMLKKGAKGFIQKPYRKRALSRKLIELLE